MAEKTDEKTAGESTDRKKTRSAPAVSATVKAVRTRAAQVVWAVCVIAALLLAGGALCVSLKANGDNSLVKFLEQTADKLDFGVFSRGKDGVAHFKGHTQAALTKNALINWGLAAVVWLVGGRIVERVVRP